jgi:hypothetical protein
MYTIFGLYTSGFRRRVLGETVSDVWEEHNSSVLGTEMLGMDNRRFVLHTTR